MLSTPEEKWIFLRKEWIHFLVGDFKLPKILSLSCGYLLSLLGESVMKKNKQGKKNRKYTSEVKMSTRKFNAGAKTCAERDEKLKACSKVG